MTRCDPCQRIQNAPQHFRSSFEMPEARFNERIMVNVIKIDVRTVLHVVDEGERFSTARYVEDESTSKMWKILIECWIAIYTDLLNRILVDKGSNLAPSFVYIAYLPGVNVKETGIESHKRHGIAEWYHHTPRQTYRKIIVEYLNTEPSLTLAVSIKALNNTLGPEENVPSA